jgi:hypothetical protein
MVWFAFTLNILLPRSHFQLRVQGFDSHVKYFPVVPLLVGFEFL